MRSRDLPRFVGEKPAEKPVCRSCKTFTPDVLVPVGQGAISLCWICAHHVIEHGVPLDKAGAGECECLPEAIYPESLLAARGRFVKAPDPAIAGNKLLARVVRS